MYVVIHGPQGSSPHFRILTKMYQRNDLDNTPHGMQKQGVEAERVRTNDSIIGRHSVGLCGVRNSGDRVALFSSQCVAPLISLCICAIFEFWNFCIPVSLFFCLSVVVSSFLFWMARWWTLETAAASLLALNCLKTVWMMSLHHGKWSSCLKQRETILFVILAHQWWFCNKICYRHHFSKLKKHRPTHLYMIYPMVQSLVHFCVEIDKKSTLQRHCPLSSSSSSKKTKSHFGLLNYLNFEYVVHACQVEHLSVDCWRSQHTSMPTRGPTCQGTGAPHYYQHTLIPRPG
jgi:hypothetical protein